MKDVIDDPSVYAPLSLLPVFPSEAVKTPSPQPWPSPTQADEDAVYKGEEYCEQEEGQPVSDKDSDEKKRIFDDIACSEGDNSEVAKLLAHSSQTKPQAKRAK